METPAEIQLDYMLDNGVGEVAAVSRRSVRYAHVRNILCLRLYYKYKKEDIWINRKRVTDYSLLLPRFRIRWASCLFHISLYGFFLILEWDMAESFGTLAINVPLYQRRTTNERNGAFWWNENCRGKPKHSRKSCPSATLSIINPACYCPGLNPGNSGEKPENDHLSHSASLVWFVDINDSVVHFQVPFTRIS
jgi:hypothetical protein